MKRILRFLTAYPDYHRHDDDILLIRLELHSIIATQCIFTTNYMTQIWSKCHEFHPAWPTTHTQTCRGYHHLICPRTVKMSPQKHNNKSFLILSTYIYFFCGLCKSSDMFRYRFGIYVVNQRSANIYFEWRKYQNPALHEIA